MYDILAYLIIALIVLFRVIMYLTFAFPIIPIVAIGIFIYKFFKK